MIDAAVVGSGPNGLAAAIHLARAGLQVRVYEAAATIGGGMRSAALTRPGFVHDVCSAVHPFGVLSPFFQGLPLAEHGVEWLQPEVMLAHPLDDGSAVALTSSLEETARELGPDAGFYRRLVGVLAERLPTLAEDILSPILRVPRHPFMLARFGMRAMLSARSFARSFEGARAQALVAGCAAHSFRSLDAPFTATFALLFTAAAHATGWPVVRGGSQKLADALVDILREHGGEIAVGMPVTAPREARVTLFDTSPEALTRISHVPMPTRPRGPGVFKIDYALSAPVPWTAEACRRAGTVHLGGTFEEIAAGEERILRGEHPERPFVLVTQASLVDPTRAPAGLHTLWAYCHVPNGSIVDMTDAIEAQLERFAPGFRDVVLARAIMNTHDLELHNPNYLGGDVSGGLGHPLFPLPHATSAEDVYLCSAATAPGPGVHGMCGFHAAEAALQRSFDRSLSRAPAPPRGSAAE